MNLILLLHIEREVTFPPESTLISILCILQIKHFKVNFQFPSQNREVFGLVIPFSSLCLRKKTWVHVFIPLWKLNTNIAQISLFHNFLVYPSSLHNFIVDSPTFQIYLLSSSCGPFLVYQTILFSFLPNSGPVLLLGEVSCFFLTSLLRDQIPAFCHFSLFLHSLPFFTFLDM